MKGYVINSKTTLMPIYAYVDVPINARKLNAIQKSLDNLADDQDLKVFLYSEKSFVTNAITGQYAKIISTSKERLSISVFVEGFAVMSKDEINKVLDKEDLDLKLFEKSSDVFSFEKKEFINIDKIDEINKKIEKISVMLSAIPNVNINNFIMWIKRNELNVALSVFYALDIDETLKEKLDIIFQNEDILRILNEIIEELEKVYIGILAIAKIKKDLEEGVKNKVLKLSLEQQIKEMQKKVYELSFNEKNNNPNFDETLLNDDEIETIDNSYRKFIKNNKFIPLEIKKLLKKDLDALERLNPSSADYNQLINYFELVKSLPWNKYSNSDTEITQKEIKEKLNTGIYGLKNVKERIEEIIAFLKIKKRSDNNQTHIICLVGPPGTGKTSIAKLISECTNREFIQISLGGMHDESELRGHRRTYVGAMPGKIISELSKIKTSNPLILLDEIDKISHANSSQGNPYHALLEILDPSQNTHFKDNYLNLPYDISQCLFVATANDMDNIPGPLYDRMQIIEIEAYTEQDKMHIAKDFIIPQKEKLAFDDSIIKFEDEAIKSIISDYTYESGVRKLSEKISIILNKIYSELVTEIENNQTDNSKKELLRNQIFDLIINKNLVITKKDIKKHLGRPIRKGESLMKEDEIGIVNGLAWTMNGGCVLNIEAVKLKGKGDIKFTGRLGDVMKESVNVAFSFIKSYLTKHEEKVDFNEFDIHVHAPDGATPKDGPSAGIALASVIYSTLTNKKIKSKVAMTGEISLTGIVLPIGGVKEKLQGAIKANMELVLLPNDNKEDYEKVDQEIKNKINVKFVKTIDEVFKEVIC